jgi:hypothetical protein
MFTVQNNCPNVTDLTGQFVKTVRGLPHLSHDIHVAGKNAESDERHQ